MNKNLKDFEAWVVTQLVNENGLAVSKKIWEEDGDDARCKLPLWSQIGCCDFTGKFANYRAGRGFHDMPDGLLGERW